MQMDKIADFLGKNGLLHEKELGFEIIAVEEQMHLGNRGA